MKKRLCFFQIPITSFVLKLTRPPLNGSCSNGRLGRHSQTHFPPIHDWRHEHNKAPFTGHPNLLELNRKNKASNWLPSNVMAAIHNCRCFQTGSPFGFLSSKFPAKMNHEKWIGWRSDRNHLSKKIHTNVKPNRKPSLKSLWKTKNSSHGCFPPRKNIDKMFHSKNSVL